ncbi:cytochrome P450 [Mycena olivaceomarginata]|nr:cytochrome P450 [Mycena olivaceomarginata]
MSNPGFLVIYSALAVLIFATLRKAFRDPRLDAIPIVGSSGPLQSYWDGLKFLKNAPALIQAGYDQYPEGIFRVPRLFDWLVVVSGPKFVREVGGAPENVLSFRGGVEGNLAIKQVIGRAIGENPYHQITIRTSLTRNLHACFPEVRDEIACAFEDVLQLRGSEWKSLPMMPTIMDVVARVSNRLFVGLPLCRNQTYLRNNVQFAVDVVRSGRRIALFPYFLRPLVAPFYSNKDKSFTVAMKILGPVIQERLAKENELGPNWPGKPNDLISWLLEDAEGEERTVPALVLRVLATNFAAIHTSSMGFTHAIFDLTTHPEYLLPMREEAKRVVEKEGWTKAGLNSMVKIDSFLRESQRLNNLGHIVMNRRVVAKDGFRFSDGTFVPRGSFLCVAARPTHYDSSIHENAAEFDGFRFDKERAEHAATRDPSQDIFTRQMISTGPDHLSFGTGKHACPGRFFAATELKAMLAHVVMNYDVAAEVEGVRPPDTCFNMSVTPNATAKVRFRKRADL